MMNKSRKALIGGKPKYFTLFRNWAHQGFFYLDKTEMLYRFLWEVTPIFILSSLNYFHNTFFYLTLVTIIVHTYNWIANDNFWAVFIHSLPNQKNPGEQATIEYLNKMQKRLIDSNAISAVLIYGSVTRNKWHDRSDIDIRFFRQKGIFNGLISYLILRRERLIALLNKQPLDAYIADDIKFLKKMRDDEIPIFLKNSDLRITKEYNTDYTTDFSKVESINNLNS